MSFARVTLWGMDIGGVEWQDDRKIGVFQYTDEIISTRIQLSPLEMPLQEFSYEFPNLSAKTFKGLPGLLADSLPDKFGNAIIDAWLSAEGKSNNDFSSVDRLCYVGSRGMGALEYEPAILAPASKEKEIEVAKLVKLANTILDKRSDLSWHLFGDDDREAMEDILRVGTSAGGARAKAILAWNPQTNEFRSGQFNSLPGFQQWLIKFDGISENRDKELKDPKGYCKIEYAYYLMATAVGINMTDCRLHHEGGRSHFMTKRFDREDDGGKLHMQSLGAIAHFDYENPYSYSYEQAIQIMKRLQLPQYDMDQQVLRAFFNVIGRNQDDHVKNIAFLMNKSGKWRLSPAYDVTYSYNPEGDWTGKHQMSINGKRDNFTIDDLISLAEIAKIKPRKAREMIEHVSHVVNRWSEFAEIAGVFDDHVRKIKNTHRLHLLD